MSNTTPLQGTEKPQETESMAIAFPESTDAANTETAAARTETDKPKKKGKRKRSQKKDKSAEKPSQKKSGSKRKSTAAISDMDESDESESESASKKNKQETEPAEITVKLIRGPLPQKAEYLANALNVENLESWQSITKAFADFFDKDCATSKGALKKFHWLIFGDNYLDTSSYRSSHEIFQIMLGDDSIIIEAYLEKKWPQIEALFESYAYLANKRGSKAFQDITVPAMQIYFICALLDVFDNTRYSNDNKDHPFQEFTNTERMAMLESYMASSKIDLNRPLPKSLVKPCCKKEHEDEGAIQKLEQDKDKKKTTKKEPHAYMEFEGITPLHFLILKEKSNTIPAIELFIKFKAQLTKKVLLEVLNWDQERVQNNLQRRGEFSQVLQALLKADGSEAAKQAVIKQMSLQNYYDKSFIGDWFNEHSTFNAKLSKYEQASLYAIYGKLSKYQELCDELVKADRDALRKWPAEHNPMKSLVDCRWLDAGMLDVMWHILTQQKELLPQDASLLILFLERLLLETKVSYTVHSVPCIFHYYYSEPHKMTKEQAPKLFPMIDAWIKSTNLNLDFYKGIIRLLLRYFPNPAETDIMIEIRKLLHSMFAKSLLEKSGINEVQFVTLIHESLKECDQKAQTELEDAKLKQSRWRKKSVRTADDIPAALKDSRINAAVYIFIENYGFDPNKLLQAFLNKYEVMKDKNISNMLSTFVSRNRDKIKFEQAILDRLPDFCKQSLLTGIARQPQAPQQRGVGGVRGSIYSFANKPPCGSMNPMEAPLGLGLPNEASVKLKPHRDMFFKKYLEWSERDPQKNSCGTTNRQRSLY